MESLLLCSRIFIWQEGELSAADVMGDDSKGSSERLEIFRAIERTANKHKSVLKAIKILRE